MGRMDGKVALITGAARGQGRSHAVRLAEEGAEIIAIDICAQIETACYEMPTTDDLDQTVKLVEDLDRRIIARTADVRDLAALKRVVDEAVAELGHIDVVCANAGIVSFVPALEIDEQTWDEVIDVNLTGVWKTIKAALPPMIARGQGGTIIITSSVAGLMGFPNLVHYSSAKHGVVGMMRVLAQELAPHNIRVNTVNPTTVDTTMCMNNSFFRLARPDLDNPTAADAAEAMRGLNTLPIPWVDPVDISNAVLWLASDEARYVTGIALPVDAGFCQKMGGTPLVLPD
jgi:SDR family mycofactocin-dependent oxidoreductase